MKRRDYTQTIPERIVSVTDYVAYDGKVFQSESECRDYEERLKEKQKVESHLVFKSRSEITTWPDGNFAYLYYFRSEEDYNFFVDDMMKLNRRYISQDDFPKFGSGFYIFETLDGGDGSDSYYIYNVDYYSYMIDTEWENWKNEVKQLMHSVEVEVC